MGPVAVDDCRHRTAVSILYVGNDHVEQISVIYFQTLVKSLRTTNLPSSLTAVP